MFWSTFFEDTIHEAPFKKLLTSRTFLHRSITLSREGAILPRELCGSVCLRRHAPCVCVQVSSRQCAKQPSGTCWKSRMTEIPSGEHRTSLPCPSSHFTSMASCHPGHFDVKRWLSFKLHFYAGMIWNKHNPPVLRWLCPSPVGHWTLVLIPCTGFPCICTSTVPFLLIKHSRYPWLLQYKVLEQN